MSHPVSSIIRASARVALGVAGVVLLIGMAACGSASTAATPTATPAPPAPTATPAGPTVLFQNSLAANPDVTQWIDDPTQGCFFAGGGYHVKDQANCGVPPLSFVQSSGTLEDADVTVQVKQADGATSVGYGIGLGGDRFDVQSDGKWAFLVCQGAKCAAAAGPTASAAIHTGLGATNTLEVRVLVNHFDLFVNGTQVGQADDPAYATGPETELALDGSDGIEVVFNNLKIATAS